MGDMTRKRSVPRSVAVVSSSALVLGAGASVGALSAELSAQWSRGQAHEAVAAALAVPKSDLTDPRPVVITRIEERHVTPEPVEVHRKVYVRVPTTPAPAPQAGATARQPARSAPAPKPSRKVVAPAPAPRPAAPSAPKAKSKTS